jgi:hypothetical protein
MYIKDNGNVLKSGLIIQFSNGRNKMVAKAIPNPDKILWCSEYRII